MFRMTVADIFFIKGRGLVATGQIEEGTLSVGDDLAVNGGQQVRVEAIEMFRKKLDTANAGDNVGVLLRDVGKDDVGRGDVLTAGSSHGVAPPPPPPDVEQQHDAANRALGRD